VGSRNDFVARSYSNREQCKVHCGCAGSNANGASRSHTGSEGLLEGGHLIAENKAGVINDSLNGSINLRLDARVLCFEVY
jgi:hypothetical protein